MQVNNISQNNTYAAVNKLKSKFSEVFENKLREFRISKASLKVSEAIIPIFCKSKPLPFAWKDRIEKELLYLIETTVYNLLIIRLVVLHWGPMVIHIFVTILRSL